MKAFLQWSTEQLKRSGIDSPRMEAEILLAAALSLSREEIYLRSDQILSEHEKSISRDLIGRRLRKEPVAHILGYKEFWSLEFEITPNVLIPRPETEILIETLISLVIENRKNQPLQLLDIGTGSGVIAIIAAREIRNCQVTATDNSPEALGVARKNAETHGVSKKINFVQSNMFKELPKASYDFILSNPPYIETTHLDDLMPDVRNFEPRCALDGGADGLDFYRIIVSEASGYLSENGRMILEIKETQAKAVSHLLCIKGRYEVIKVIQDSSGYDRAISARKRTNG